MRNVRKMMLRGEKPASCLKCYKEEEAGHLSKRNWETQYWGNRYDLFDLVKETAQDGALDPKIRYIDLRMGTKCQLACVMCSPHDSSGWIKDWQDMYPQIENEKLKNTSGWDNKGQIMEPVTIGIKIIPLLERAYGASAPHVSTVFCWRRKFNNR